LDFKSSLVKGIDDTLLSFILKDVNELVSINICPSSTSLTIKPESGSSLDFSMTLSNNDLSTASSDTNLAKVLKGILSNSG